MFNTYLLLVCQLLVIRTAPPWNSTYTVSQTSSHLNHFHRPHNPVLHLSKAWVKIWMAAALTSDIRQTSDLHSKCCTSKPSMWDECRGSLFSVTRWDPKFVKLCVSLTRVGRRVHAEMSCCDGVSRKKRKNTHSLVPSVLWNASQILDRGTWERGERRGNFPSWWSFFAFSDSWDASQLI